MLLGTRTADRSLVDAETGEKFIGIMDEGELQIYGQEKLGWTRLTQTVFPLTDAEESNVVYSHGVLAV